jgi:hypothetical protein
MDVADGTLYDRINDDDTDVAVETDISSTTVEVSVMTTDDKDDMFSLCCSIVG